MFSSLASSVLTFVYASGVQGKFTWWIAISLVMIVRVVDLIEWQFRSRKNLNNGFFGIVRFGTGAILTAILWSVHTLLFMPSMDVAEFCFSAIVLSSFAAGAIPLLSPSRFVSLSYCLILSLPVGIICFISEQTYQQFLGYVILPSSLLLIPLCFKTAKFTQKAIHQNHQNEHLIAQMTLEKNRTTKSNHELKIASSKLDKSNSELEQEIKKRTEQILQMSNIDSLTKLLNRKAFTINLEKLINTAQSKKHSLALLFIDLNGFKKINDTMGHKVGDSVLTQVTQRIVAFAEVNRVGRWGGDEFLVALPYSDEDTAMSIASAIITSIDQPIYVHGNELHLTATIGVALAPVHSTSATELIQLADLTMCEQKSTSLSAPRMFTTHLKEKIEASQKILEGLQHAIQYKQLYLCYQPIVSADEHVPWAFEALLRWDFNGTFIGPDVFIPLAEKSGLIKEIGAWVLNRACMDAKHWQHCADATVSVNVSVIQLMDDGFIRQLDNCLQSSALPPHRLHIEVTESTFAENESKVLFQLEQIRQRHVKISIDDFGTGYSSLSQLQTLPVNYVKIDKTFVDNINDKGEAIIRATQFIAQELNCKTIAEGVESLDQAKMLASMGVDYLQGYYFAKPMKNDDLIIWQNPISNSSI
ncbi:bifunctional diguanylate cyclase/phosphodiesterase [Paraglaciecola aquimarina]|uniref:Bifunctional diguanylate cyclase/phosphodiesterase n=1 Tax=Paraglaciecola algarum TaxID=3050085 RepID=A0ABS9D561_9ALTE|nr:bifunctional diguanylate cyclase/phosphodiesterase [Paraglaciecola sp. G1-23]MCF2948078.1 bifunctional diguanylate cyclase/phosphodiesterase [Paraglaciecola sp. G1-23]